MPCKTHEEYEKAIGKGYDDDDEDDKKGYGDDEDEMKSCKYHDGGDV